MTKPNIILVKVKRQLTLKNIVNIIIGALISMILKNSIDSTLRITKKLFHNLNEITAANKMADKAYLKTIKLDSEVAVLQEEIIVLKDSLHIKDTTIINK